MTDEATPPAAEPTIPAGPPLSESSGVPEAPSPSATTDAAPEPQAAPEPEPSPEPAPDPLAVMRAEATRVAREEAARAIAEARAAVPQVAPEPQPPPPAPEPPAPFPNRAAFDDPAAFDAAVQQWHALETARVARETVRQAQADAARDAAAQRQREADEAAARQQREANDRMLADWNTRRAKALETMPDFAAVAERADVTISPPMAATIMQIENGPQVAYHLGKNPAEAARIAALPPLNAVFELGRLAASLAAPKPPAVTRAPDPIRPVGGATPAVAPALADLSMEEYAARRREQMRARAH